MVYLVQKKVHKLNPLVSNRFLVYSYNAMAVYPHLEDYQEFLKTPILGEWTRSFLNYSLRSETMRSELRVLCLFHFFFSNPVCYTLSILTVGEASTVWKSVEEYVSFFSKVTVSDQLPLSELSFTQIRSFLKL